MKYGYYPGCSLEGISAEYDDSIRSLFKRLDVTIEDLPGWICCGTVAAPSMSRLLGLATPLWNVARAKQAGYDQLIAPCSACLYHFKHAAQQVAESPALRAEVEAVLALGVPLASLPPTVHPLEILSADAFESRINQLVQRDLSALKAVCYYGCHISRPAKVMQFDDPENPQSMDRLMKWVGVQVLDWPSKVDCCGAHFSLIKPGIVVDLCTRLFESALEAGAEAIIVGCPMCHANLDTRQDEIAAKLGRPLNMPVLYFSQVLGFALGLSPDVLGFKKHIVDPVPLMLEKCHLSA
ncbi:MAG: CoB--CoM heterodisulfide reductase iron-sulfur subunit B family protein [Chloroflexi bacterium]|nr:CoB--CoM heterodisulfide reductase iron-sulfur subunit B family protein [Chloroflexota bacterium]MBI5828499.1 CoB--CoM heterodisulfide reductase iron-sulfur subunit B family protein [Chloroflexota bacterium]